MLDQLFLTVNEWMTGGVMIAAAGCFLWGMISVAFSPCHLASIPLMVTYVAGQNQILKPAHAARYAVVFTTGLFVSIAAVGIICSLLGRMLGEIGSYWTILVGAPQPKLIEILKLLPKTNCRECGQPTCMVFASLAVEGVKGVEDCPVLAGENREKLSRYLSQFKFGCEI